MSDTSFPPAPSRDGGMPKIRDVVVFAGDTRSELPGVVIRWGHSRRRAWRRRVDEYGPPSPSAGKAIGDSRANPRGCRSGTAVVASREPPAGFEPAPREVETRRSVR